MQVKTVSADIMQDLLQEAEKSPRKRAHYRLHPVLEDPVQRLCITCLRGTYIRPHNHMDPDKWELFTALSGRAVLFIFDDSGLIVERFEISGEGDPAFSVEIPPAAWHSLIVTSDYAHLMEIKPGPYVQIGENGFAAWAPREGDDLADAFVKWLEGASTGMKWTAPTS